MHLDYFNINWAMYPDVYANLILLYNYFLINDFLAMLGVKRHFAYLSCQLSQLNNTQKWILMWQFNNIISYHYLSVNLTELWIS